VVSGAASTISRTSSSATCTHSGSTKATKDAQGPTCRYCWSRATARARTLDRIWLSCTRGAFASNWTNHIWCLTVD
jgi:hypothetical protein